MTAGCCDVVSASSWLLVDDYETKGARNKKH